MEQVGGVKKVTEDIELLGSSTIFLHLEVTC